jgi:spore maturation protein CgeB
MIGPEALADIFGRSKVVLGVGTCGHTRDLITMKLRDFDAPMSGAVYVTTRNPELYPFVQENEQIAFYESPKEAADKVERYLKDESELKRVSSAAYARCRKEHTWKQRLERLSGFWVCLPSKRGKWDFSLRVVKKYPYFFIGDSAHR